MYLEHKVHYTRVIKQFYLTQLFCALISYFKSKVNIHHSKENINLSHFIHTKELNFLKKIQVKNQINNNNNNSTNEKGNYRNSVWLSNSSYQREFLLSDDEDSVAITSNGASPRSDQSKQRSNNSNATGTGNNSQKSRSIFGGCQGNHSIRKMIKFLSMNIYFLISKMLFLVINFSRNIFSEFLTWLKNFSGERNLWKVPVSFPVALLERLYCFCSLNECRRINVRTYFSLPRKPTSCSDEVLTKCSWPMWAIGTVFLSIFILGCYYSSPNATLMQRYNTGLENLEYLYNLAIYNLYNLPGSDCMIKDNCCVSGTMAFRRWIHCFVSLPYRIAFTGMKVESSDMSVIDESLQNLSDWRLRRNIYRMKSLLEELRRKVNIIGKKIYQADQALFTLKTVSDFNLSSVLRIINEEEQLDLIYEDNIKKLEKVQSNLQILANSKALFEKTAVDARNCAKCTSRKMATELEKTIGDDMKIVNKFANRVKTVERKAHSKIGYNPIGKEFESIRKDVTTIEKCLTKWHTTLSQLENFKITFISDMDLLRHHVNDLTANEMARQGKTNAVILERVAAMFSDLHSRIDQFLSQRKVTATHLIVKHFNHNGQLIFSAILKEFCPKIRDFVKATIQNTMTLSNTVKACGVFDSSSFAPKKSDACGIQLVDCLNQTVVSMRINKALEDLSSDSIGLVDYALKSNGGQILESHSTPSLHVDMFDDNQEVSESNWPFLNILMLSSPTLVSSINFLNIADNDPGRCWLFRGNKGITIIKLSLIIKVTMVTIDHIYPEIALSKNVDDAVKDFDIIAVKGPNDLVGILLGSFTFSLDNDNPIQQFSMSNPTSTKYIKFVIKSNHGSDVTCVYRIRIHGVPVDQ